MDLVVAVYSLTDKFPKTEQYGLISQMRRCAISLPSNIAEGSRRKTNKDFSHFLIMALGSGSELETQIEIAKRLQFAREEDSIAPGTLLNEVMRMLNKFIESRESI